jgi:ubiquinone biosynthesis monooxygenase Coq7
MRTNSPFYPFLLEIDAALRTLFPPNVRASMRESPAKSLENPKLTLAEKKHVAGLMRVNHAGEVCAQALYQGQAFSAQLDAVKTQMQEAAKEEIDHLAWCEQRLHELDSKPSLLNPIWYVSAWGLGTLAGLAGDTISLGFVAETEKQVSAHLEKHLEKLPKEDDKTRAILECMLEDETLHAQMAQDAGGIILPGFVQKLMRLTAKVMTNTSYYG